jgi:hypothetical protein
MTARRRPFASLFAALLVWLTAVSTVQVAHPDEMRLIGAESEVSSGLVIAAARASVAAPRLPSRPSTIPQPDLALPAPSPVLLPGTPDHRAAPLLLAHVRDAHGLSPTYDALGPPVGS